jgi:hypothetical protein
MTDNHNALAISQERRGKQSDSENLVPPFLNYCCCYFFELFLTIGLI